MRQKRLPSPSPSPYPQAKAFRKRRRRSPFSPPPPHCEPPPPQVASQQGTYLARLFSRGFEFSATVPQKSSGSGAETGADGTEGGGVPSSEAFSESEDVPLSEKLGLSVVKGKFAKPFQFLNLGILAYTGADGALAQVQVRGQLSR